MTEDTQKKTSTDASPAPDEFATIPEQPSSPPPPMSFAGSAGTGAIRVEDAPTQGPQGQTDAPHPPDTDDAPAPDIHDTPVVLEPLPVDAEDAAATSGTIAGATRIAGIGEKGAFRRARGANAGLSAPPAPPTPVKAGPAENSFQLLSFIALFSLALILAVQQFTSIYTPSIFTAAELSFAGMYEHMLASSQWLTPPHLANFPAALPVYFWFMRLVDAIPYADGSFLYPLISAGSAFVALAGVYTLGLATGFGNRVAFAAGLILLSSLGFSPLGHYLSPDLFFAGMLAFSMACLYRGWISQQSYVWLALGFALAGLSTLTGGLMGLVVPLLTSLGFVVWRGTFRRGHQLDAVFGFALLLVVILAWFGAVILLTGESSYLYTLSRQIFAPLIGPLWPPQDPWWLYAVRVPVALLPWVLVVLFVPWGRVCASAWPNVKASRNDKAGSAWLWISLFVSCVYLFAISTKPCLAFVPLFPIAALLLAKALLGLPAAHSRGFFLLLALGFAVAALTLVALSIPFALTAISVYLPAPVVKALQHMQGLPIMAGVCALSALVLWKGTRRALPAGSLLVTVLLVTMLIQPATLMLSPSLKGVAGHSPSENAGQAVPQAETQAEPAQTEATPAKPTEAAPEKNTTGQNTSAPSDAEQTIPAVAPAPMEALAPTEPAPVQPDVAAPEADFGSGMAPATPPSDAPAAPLAPEPAPAASAP